MMSWTRANPVAQRLVALMQDDSHKGLPGRIAIRQPFSVAPARLTYGRAVLHFGHSIKGRLHVAFMLASMEQRCISGGA